MSTKSLPKTRAQGLQLQRVSGPPHIKCLPKVYQMYFYSAKAEVFSEFSLHPEPPLWLQEALYLTGSVNYNAPKLKI